MFRRRVDQRDPSPAQVTSPGVDPLQSWVAGLDPRWQAPVQKAVASRDRFLALLAQAPPGPTRDRLEELRRTLEVTVHRIAEAVWRASNAAAIAATLDVASATAELKEARRHLDALEAGGADTTAAEQRVRAMAERHRAVSDAMNLAEDATLRLGEVNVRLDTAVAQAAAVMLRSAQDGRIDEVDRELDDVITGLVALDDALEHLAR